MNHAMYGMAEIVNTSGFDYTLAFIAGFLGSGHCLGMCGALVSGYFIKTGTVRSIWPYLAYQATRLCTYGLVGMSAAALGVVLISNGMFGTMQSILQMLIGGIVIVLALGILGLLPFQGTLRLIPMQSLHLGYSIARRKSPVPSAMMMGLLNGLMPCPLTFAMAVKATTAHTLLEGGALMLVFGAGTLPMMLFISIAFSKISSKIRGLMLKLAALVMIAMGANTINKGLEFYLHQHFAHSTFLNSVQDKLHELMALLSKIAIPLTGIGVWH